MNNGKIFQLVKTTLRHMDAITSNEQSGSMLLTGDPGIGKSTFIGMLGQLLGMQTIIIEVPHITEEHLINIPFVIFDPVTNTTQQDMEKTSPVGADGVAVKKNPKYKLVLAQSKLFSHLTSAHAVPDQQYLKYMATAPAHIQQLFNQLGGTADTIPPAIAEARQHHKVILFLDEFYRQTTLRIRNILRGLLNRKIGMHKLPSTAYLIYASNMADQGGLDEITTNQHFAVVDYETPTKDEWFDWLISSYEADARVKMNSEVVKEFKKVLVDDDISYQDFSSGVRTSPRRWEQILLYINTSLPVKNAREATTLLTNVKNNFIHYKHLAYSEKLMKKVLEATKRLIQKTSNIDVPHDSTLEEHDWRESLDHMLQQYMKSGGRRKHIPVISGPPGIGKTTHLGKVAADNDLLLIDVIVSDLNSDDATGMPIPGERTGDKITVNFSMPKLYQQIMVQIEEAREQKMDELRNEDPSTAEQKMKEFDNQRWKYLIFLDEINTVDEKTFNALRRVILEKSFGPSDDEDDVDSTTGKTKELWNNKEVSDTGLSEASGRLYNKPNNYFGCGFVKLNNVVNTIIANDTLVLYDEQRHLSKKELCKIGSYPLDYNFLKIKPHYLIGMSVPPLMTGKIAEQIHKQWLSKL